MYNKYMETSKESVVCVFNKEKDLIAIIYKDMNIRKNIIYKCQEAEVDEIQELISKKTC